MRKTRLKPVSEKRQQELEKEKAIRQQLMERCRGRCEKCGEAPDWRGLHPHEFPFRSHGGKVSLKDSKMLCALCHDLAHGIKSVASSPMWSKAG